MINLWTREDINRILLQLDSLFYPFPEYSLFQEDDSLKHIGHGGSAEVYEVYKRDSLSSKFALKVIGFGKQNLDSDSFYEAVSLQKEIGEWNNVVKIYKYTELWIVLDENDDVVSVEETEPRNISKSTLKLQFILMEKLSPVITRDKKGSIRMMPESLAYGDERELLILANDIGNALKVAHNKNILHRDVKLENVFYSEKKNRYMLGDFGIAKKTLDGFANTIAFTKGYVAPEVRTSDESYDNTADIYSFGMMLYVLANRLRFPDSSGYSVNSVQYTEDYILPYPDSNISRDFYNILVKACSYNAYNRYHSIDEMLIDIEKLLHGDSTGYKVEHKNAQLALGSMMLIVGLALWKLTLMPETIISFSGAEYIFIAICLIQSILLYLDKVEVNMLVSVGMLGLGIYLIVTTGFSWIKLVVLLFMVISLGYISAYVALGALVMNFVSIAQRAEWSNITVNESISWIAVLLITLSVMLFVEYIFLVSKNIQRYEKKSYNWFITSLKHLAFICCWYIWSLMYLVIIWFDKEVMDYIKLESSIHNLEAECKLRIVLGRTISDFLFDVDLGKVGFYGFIFCVFWILREKIYISRQRKLRIRKN